MCSVGTMARSTRMPLIPLPLLLAESLKVLGWSEKHVSVLKKNKKGKIGQVIILHPNVHKYEDDLVDVPKGDPVHIAKGKIEPKTHKKMQDIQLLDKEGYGTGELASKETMQTKAPSDYAHLKDKKKPLKMGDYSTLSVTFKKHKDTVEIGFNVLSDSQQEQIIKVLDKIPDEEQSFTGSGTFLVAKKHQKKLLKVLKKHVGWEPDTSVPPQPTGGLPPPPTEGGLPPFPIEEPPKQVAPPPPTPPAPTWGAVTSMQAAGTYTDVNISVEKKADGMIVITAPYNEEMKDELKSVVGYGNYDYKAKTKSWEIKPHKAEQALKVLSAHTGFDPMMAEFTAAYPESSAGIPVVAPPPPAPPPPPVTPAPTPPAPGPVIPIAVGGGLPVPVVPEPKKLDKVGSGNYLGGQGEKTIYEDSKGQQWIFKQAVDKNGKKSKPFAAAAQQAFSSVALKVNPKHIPVGVATVGGKLGTLQPLITLANPKTLKEVLPGQLNDQEKKDVASEHVLSWLMSEHDGHGANLIRTADGRVLGVDKEQAFKYFPNDKLDVDYHPNATYGENPPYHNKFWKAWRDGDVDFDPMEMLPAIQAVEGISAKAYMATLKPYAEALWPGKVKEQNKFLKDALHRKLHLRSDFEKFATGLYREKDKAPKGKFSFALGWLPDAGPKEVTTTAKAQELVDSYGVKVYNYEPVPGEIDQTKTTLKLPKHLDIAKLQEFIADAGLTPLEPAQGGSPWVTGNAYHLVSVSKDAFEKATITKTEIVSPMDVAEAAKLPEHFPVLHEHPPTINNSDELDHLQDEVIGYSGKKFTSDGGLVEGQNLVAKKHIGKDGKLYYLFQFKLRKKDWMPLRTGGSGSTYAFPEGQYDSKVDAIKDKDESYAHSDSTKTRKWASGDSEVHLAAQSDAGSYGKYTYMGSVYAKIRPKPGQSPRDALDEALDTMKPGLSKEVLRDPTPVEKETRKLVRILWAVAPQEADKLNKSDATPAKLRVQLKSHGITDKEIDSIEEQSVTDMQNTFVKPGRYKQLAGGTFRYMFNGVGHGGSVAGILESGALLAIHERNMHGIGQFGGSYPHDVESGSGDGILVRAVCDSGIKGGSIKFSDHPFCKGGVAIVIAPDEVDRMDAYSYLHDAFGKCVGSSSTWKGRNTVESNMDGMKNFHKLPNEISFRRGISTRKFLRIACRTASMRKDTIKACKEKGINEVNGVPIDDFIVVSDDLSEVFTKYVKPLGY